MVNHIGTNKQPKGPNYHKTVALFKEGHDKAEIGRQLNITRTRVWQIVEEAKRRGDLK